MAGDDPFHLTIVKLPEWTIVSSLAVISAWNSQAHPWIESGLQSVRIGWPRVTFTPTVPRNPARIVIRLVEELKVNAPLK